MAKVLLKKSSVSGNAPGTGDLAYGELAINYADGRLYYKNSSNEIKNFVDSDTLLASYLRSVFDDKLPVLGGSLDISGYKLYDGLRGPGSFLSLDYNALDSGQPSAQVVLSSRQDVSIIIDANNDNTGKFYIRANDSDIDVASTVFTVDELGNVDITGTLDMNLNKITGLDEPAATSDATTKLYVDNAVASVVGLEPYPTGDWGTVDSALATDAFGVVIGQTYDHMDPVGKLAYQDFGAVT